MITLSPLRLLTTGRLLTALAAAVSAAEGDHAHDHKHDHDHDHKHDHDHEHDHKHDHDHDHRAHGAHVHGLANLNLVLDGENVLVELQSPAANLVGFEHAPSSEADKTAVQEAVRKLEAGNALFAFNSEAGCALAAAEVKSDQLAMQDHEHDHSHDDGSTHSEFFASWQFDCSSPAALKSVTTDLFAQFSGFEEITVQYIINEQQGAAELRASQSQLSF